MCIVIYCAKLAKFELKEAYYTPSAYLDEINQLNVSMFK
jgi:hypothetical protein